MEPVLAHHATWLPQLSACFEGVGDLEVHWVVISRAPVPAEPIRWRGQTFHLLHNPQRLRAFRGYRRDCRLIQEQIERIQPDLVHAWGTEDCYGLAGALSGRPWLLSMQGILQEYIRLVPMHPFVHLQALYERFVLRRAEEISVESHWGAEVIKRLAPHSRTHLVEYGVQELFFAAKWEPDERKPYAVFAGTTHDGRKGLQDVVQAFADPLLQGKELHIVGDRDSKYARKLQALSTPNVHWLGRLPTAETVEVLRRAWVLVLPTRADTSPNVVKEARVIGLPVITTSQGGQSDYIKDGVNGFIVEPGDVKRLGVRCTQVLENITQARALGAIYYHEQREHFQPQRTATLFRELYARILEAQAS